MKDKEFIELLNLYLDHEISAADATRLEVEVQRNPERYRLYQQYCRMHKACTMLSVEEAALAPTRAAFENERPAWRPNFGYMFGGVMAAAACVAFVVMQNGSTDATNRAAELAATPATAPVVSPALAQTAPEGARVIPATVTVAPRRAELHPVIAPRSLRLTDNPLVTSEVIAAEVKLDWMEKMQLSSLPSVPLDALRFETTKATLKTNTRSYGPVLLQETAESAAWEFRR
jgi:hypothetical protein